MLVRWVACFPRDAFQVHCLNFHGLTNGFLFLPSPAMSQRLCPALLLAGGTACGRPSSLPPQQSGAVLIPTALPALWAQNLRAISGPFVVDLAWENLRSWLLDTTAFLRGVKVIPWAWLLRSSGLAPCCWFPGPPVVIPWPPAREQNTHGWDGLPVDKRLPVASGVVKAQKNIYLKMGPFCSMDLEHACL